MAVSAGAAAAPPAAPAAPKWAAPGGGATRRAVGRDDVEFVPGLTVGFTDSRFVRPLGNVAYGFMPGHPESDPSKSGAHNINESIDLNTIVTITRYLVALAWDTVVAHD